MREIRIKSALPVYGLAAAWLLYSLFFPLYKLWHFAAAAAAAVAVYLILSRLFPGKTVLVPEEPVATGDAEIDGLLAEGHRAVGEMRRLRDAVKSPLVRGKIGNLIGVTEKIFKALAQEPAALRQVRRFASYYLPTTIKLLHTYDRLGAVGSEGENITGTMERIDAILDTTLAGYKKQLDALYAHQALDIETDIDVLEAMLKKEGLTGRDFS